MRRSGGGGRERDWENSDGAGVRHEGSNRGKSVPPGDPAIECAHRCAQANCSPMPPPPTPADGARARATVDPKPSNFTVAPPPPMPSALCGRAAADEMRSGRRRMPAPAPAVPKRGRLTRAARAAARAAHALASEQIVDAEASHNAADEASPTPTHDATRQPCVEAQETHVENAQSDDVLPTAQPRGEKIRKGKRRRQDTQHGTIVVAESVQPVDREAIAIGPVAKLRRCEEVVQDDDGEPTATDAPASKLQRSHEAEDETHAHVAAEQEVDDLPTNTATSKEGDDANLEVKDVAAAGGESEQREAKAPQGDERVAVIEQPDESAKASNRQPGNACTVAVNTDADSNDGEEHAIDGRNNALKRAHPGAGDAYGDYDASIFDGLEGITQFPTLLTDRVVVDWELQWERPVAERDITQWLERFLDEGPPQLAAAPYPARRAEAGGQRYASLYQNAGQRL